MKFRISDNLCIDTEAEVVRKQGLRIAIIGESGSGKSWTMAVFGEQAIQQGLQVVFFDVHGEYFSFREVFENVLVIGGENADLPLNPDIIPVYMEAYRQGFSLDFNLREYLADEYEYGMLVEKILRALWKVQVNNPRPALWILEEAHLIAPQEKSRDVMRRVGLIKAIATGGRKFGILLLMGTQRPAELHKTPLSQCYIRFFGKLTERLDRKAVEDYLKPLKSDLLKSLKTGQFYVYGWYDQPVLVKVTSKRVTRHGAETPLIKPIKRVGRVKKNVEQLRKMVEEILAKKRMEEEEREKLRAEIRELEKALENERGEKEELLKELDKLKMEIDILSRVKGVDKLTIEKAIMEVKQLSTPTDKSLLDKIRVLEEENARLRRELEKMSTGHEVPVRDETLLAKIRELEDENTRLKEEIKRLRQKRAVTPVLSPMDEKRIREWVENLKSRLRAFANTPSRKKLLKFLISIDEKREFYPEWISNEVGMSSGWARNHLKQLGLMFRVGIVTLDGRKMTTSLVESRTVKRRIVYRNNIKEYVRVCLNMMVLGLDQSVVERVLNEIYSYVYSL